MKREIKFRGKAVSNNEWVYGNFIHSKRFEGCGNEFRIHNMDTGLESDVDIGTVGQLTGLRDTAGTQIWEGDIVKVFRNWHGEPSGTPFNSVIIFNEFMAYYQISYKNMDGHFVSDDINFKFLTVIGNILEQPELLT